MPRFDCQMHAQSLAEPLRDLGFMLSCYDVYSGPQLGPLPGPLPGRSAACDAEAPHEGDRE